MQKRTLTIEILCEEASKFAASISKRPLKSLYGVTDGKAVGTFLEHQFREHLRKRFQFREGSSAKGIDFPQINVDVKVTSIKQPQSSCPFTSARQKIFGLGYSLLLFVYRKSDDPKNAVTHLKILHAIFIEKKRTADFQTTRTILQILDNGGNEEELAAFMRDRNLPVDDIQAFEIAKEILQRRPEQGYLTISNALQWRLQYKRVIMEADKIQGISRLK
ncbi:MAG: hypothetical protein JXB10_15685 [Pirellulales bacterium]|nr:hypothetical protein [Pirellulales bacterium]